MPEPPIVTEAIWVILAGVAAGFLNSVVGAGTLVTYPVLLAIGLPPMQANVTSAVGIFPGSLSAALSYRGVLSQARALIPPTLIGMIAGIALGIPLLLALPPGVFSLIVPWLILAAGALTLAQPYLIGRLKSGQTQERHRPWVMAAGLVLAGAYLAYFGAATGIITISVLLFAATRDIQVANALKNLATGIGNGLVAVAFLALAEVQVNYALMIAVGSVVGGAIGGRLAQRLSPRIFRIIVAVIAVGATIAAFVAS